MKILQTVKKIPGGLMVIPLLLGAALNTWAPGLITIGGDSTFTTYLWKSGAMPILAVFLFCNGAQINVKSAGVPLAKGVILTAIKFFIGAALGWLVNSIWGPDGIWGLTPLALIGAITNSNGGLYAALSGEFGDATDVGAVSILSINDGPFLTMVAMGATGIAEIDGWILVGCVAPIVVGCILGNLDEDIRKFTEAGATILIPFFAFPLGAGLIFTQLISAGLSGILLGVICCILTGGAGYLLMRLIRSKHAECGGAIGTTAGNAAGTPAAVAAADVSLSPYVTAATAQMAASCIVTAILCPIFVNLLHRYEVKRRAKVETKKAAKG